MIPGGRTAAVVVERSAGVHDRRIETSRMDAVASSATAGRALPFLLHGPALCPYSRRVATNGSRNSPLASDEPAALGGSDTAPNPVEQLLAALGNCLAVGYAANASAAGIEISELRISLEGDIDLHTFLGLSEGNAGYNSIRVQVDLKSNATEEQRQALHRKVVHTSPVGHTLSRAVPVQIDLR
jgi:uncharacterized OsmC-like protein